MKFVGWYYRMHIKLVPFSVLSGPDLEGGAFGLVPPRNNAKNILLSHILHEIKKKCVSLAQLLLPDVNKQSFGHDSCCYLNHLPGYYPSFLIYCIFSDLINWCPLPSCWAVPPPPPPPRIPKSGSSPGCPHNSGNSRALESESRGPGFVLHTRCPTVSLSKTN